MDPVTVSIMRTLSAPRWSMCCLQIFSNDFCARHADHMINIHHSFLPAFEGARPYHRAHGVLPLTPVALQLSWCSTTPQIMCLLVRVRRHYAFNAERGVKIIGATAHYATAELDAGPVIEQDVTRISHRDSVADMVRKGRDLERLVLARALRWHLQDRVLITQQNKTIVFD